MAFKKTTLFALGGFSKQIVDKGKRTISKERVSNEESGNIE